MKLEPVGVQFSAIDSDRLGIRVARTAWMTVETLPAALDFCRRDQIALLIATCDVNERRAITAMERAGFLLMEAMVVYERDFARRPLPPERPVGKATVRPVEPADVETVVAIARRMFQGYVSHYHADDRLDPAKCDEIYSDWARRSCLSREVADEVLVAEEEGAITGFLTLRMNTPEEGEPPLSGMVPDARGRGAYETLVNRGMEWACDRGAKKFIGVMQINNAGVLGAALRAGLFPKSAYFVFHKWFDQAIR